MKVSTAPVTLLGLRAIASPALLAGLFVCLAPAQTVSSPPPISPPAQRLLLLGVPGSQLANLPGVDGQLGLDLVMPCPPELGTTASAQLCALRQLPELRPMGAIHYQVLSWDPDRARLCFSDVMRLPIGSEQEAVAVVRCGAREGGGAPTASEIVYPTVQSIEMTLTREPIHTLWTRYLTFRDHTGADCCVPVAFARKSGLTWTGTVDAAGLAVLQSLADTGNRSHWDDMKLENYGGTTELCIAKLMVVLHYDKSSAYEEDVPIVDSYLYRTLAAGTSSIDLDAYATATRKAWAGITTSMHAVVQLAAADFGKSGSDGSDNYPSNPKFGGADNNLCSEFVSWYLHQAGVVIGGEDFEDITGTAQIDAAFAGAGRRYDYNNASQEWIHSASAARYTPQPGDFLARRYGGEYEHAMIVLSWDNASKIMTVINGPWPVTLRYVAIQDLEEDGYDFRVGKIR